jgi:hypothetical protein
MSAYEEYKRDLTDDKKEWSMVAIDGYFNAVSAHYAEKLTVVDQRDFSQLQEYAYAIKRYLFFKGLKPNYHSLLRLFEPREERLDPTEFKFVNDTIARVYDEQLKEAKEKNDTDEEARLASRRRHLEGYSALYADAFAKDLAGEFDGLLDKFKQHAADVLANFKAPSEDVELTWLFYMQIWQSKYALDVEQARDFKQRYWSVLADYEKRTRDVDLDARGQFTKHEIDWTEPELRVYLASAQLSLASLLDRAVPDKDFIISVEYFIAQILLQLSMDAERVSPRRHYTEFIAASTRTQNMAKQDPRPTLEELKDWKADVDRGFLHTLSRQIPEAVEFLLADLGTRVSIEHKGPEVKSPIQVGGGDEQNRDDTAPRVSPLNVDDELQPLHSPAPAVGQEEAPAGDFGRPDLDTAIGNWSDALLDLKGKAEPSNGTDFDLLQADIDNVFRLAGIVDSINKNNSSVRETSNEVQFIQRRFSFLNTLRRAQAEWENEKADDDALRGYAIGLRKAVKAYESKIATEDNPLLDEALTLANNIDELRGVVVEAETTDIDNSTDVEMGDGDGDETEDEDPVILNRQNAAATRRAPVKDATLLRLDSHVSPQVDACTIGLINAFDRHGLESKVFARKLLMSAATSTDQTEAATQLNREISGVMITELVKPKPGLELKNHAKFVTDVKDTGYRISDMKPPVNTDKRTGFLDLAFSVSMETAACILHIREKEPLTDFINDHVINPLMTHMKLPTDAKDPLDLHAKLKGFYSGFKKFDQEKVKNDLANVGKSIVNLSLLWAYENGERATEEDVKKGLGGLTESDADLLRDEFKGDLDTADEIEKAGKDLEKKQTKLKAALAVGVGAHKGTRDGLAPHMYILLALTRDGFPEMIEYCHDQTLSANYDTLVWCLTTILFCGCIQALVYQRFPFSAQEEPWQFGAWIALDRVRKMKEKELKKSQRISSYMQRFNVTTKKGTDYLWARNETNKYDSGAFDQLLDGMFYEYLRAWGKWLPKYASINLYPPELARAQLWHDPPMFFATTIPSDETEIPGPEPPAVYDNFEKKNKEGFTDAASYLEVAEQEEQKKKGGKKKKALTERETEKTRIENARKVLKKASRKYTKVTNKLPRYDDRVIAAIEIYRKPEAKRTADENALIQYLSSRQSKMLSEFGMALNIWELVRERRAFGGLSDQPLLECVITAPERKVIYDPSVKPETSADKTVANYFNWMQTRAIHIYLQVAWLDIILREAPKRVSDEEKAARAVARIKAKADRNKQQEEVKKQVLDNPNRKQRKKTTDELFAGSGSSPVEDEKGIVDFTRPPPQVAAVAPRIEWGINNGSDDEGEEDTQPVQPSPVARLPIPSDSPEHEDTSQADIARLREQERAAIRDARTKLIDIRDSPAHQPLGDSKLNAIDIKDSPARVWNPDDFSDPAPDPSLLPLNFESQAPGGGQSQEEEEEEEEGPTEEEIFEAARIFEAAQAFELKKALELDAAIRKYNASRQQKR